MVVVIWVVDDCIIKLKFCLSSDPSFVGLNANSDECLLPSGTFPTDVYGFLLDHHLFEVASHSEALEVLG